MSTHVLCPEDVLAAIAWYPDGLDDERRGAVEAHAANCVACRDELALVGGAAAPVAEASELEDAYARVRARIEGIDRSEAFDGTETAAPAVVSSILPASRRQRFADRPWAALAAGVAIALLSGAVGLGLGGGLAGTSQASYETAIAGPPSVQGPVAGPALEVVFRPEAAAAEIHEVLRAVGGSVVSGPTPLGVYRIGLVTGADEAAAARMLRGDGRGVATFAEPTTH